MGSVNQMEQKSKEVPQSKPGLNLSDRTIQLGLERVWVSPTNGWDNFLSVLTCQGTSENVALVDVWLLFAERFYF